MTASPIDIPQSPIRWLPVLAASALPLGIALTYGVFASTPDRFPAEFSLALALLFLAELPACLLAGAFAGALVAGGASARRWVVLSAVAAGILSVGVMIWQLMWQLINDDVLGGMLALNVTSHLLAMALPARADGLDATRAEAIGEDAASQVVLTLWCGLLAIALALLAVEFAPHWLNALGIALRWSDLAWVGAAHFAMRWWSIIYVKRAAFFMRRRGLLDRPWVHAVIFHVGRSAPYDSPLD